MKQEAIDNSILLSNITGIKLFMVTVAELRLVAWRRELVAVTCIDGSDTFPFHNFRLIRTGTVNTISHTMHFNPTEPE